VDRLQGEWGIPEDSPAGRQRLERALAELIIAEDLKRSRWQEADLKTRTKGDSVKVALAARLRAETTMTVGWIAERLAMGTRGYLNHLLCRRRKLGGE
jgi:predicted transcriptional regulator